MLKGIDPRMTADLMDVLIRLGHGDELLLSDTNYPSHSNPSDSGQLIELPGFSITDALSLILPLLPIDSFTDYAALWMQRDGAGDTPDPVHQGIIDTITPFLPQGGQIRSLERQAFYAHARGVYAVVRCTETRPYGNVILRTGVVF